MLDAMLLTSTGASMGKKSLFTGLWCGTAEYCRSPDHRPIAAGPGCPSQSDRSHRAVRLHFRCGQRHWASSHH